MDTLVLAFDIERSGCGREHDTIGLGACVMDYEMNELDRFFFSCYLPKETVFEQRCWDEFWVNNLDILEQLKYEGSQSKKEREKEMIVSFQEFRKKWEKYAENNGKILVLTSDNKVYDGGFVNQLIFEHMPGTLPIPYSAEKQKYSAFFETHSAQRGLLYSVCPSYDKNRGLSEKVLKLYEGIPEQNKTHSHNPADDAYTIAFDQQVLFGIKNEKYTLKKST